MSHLIASQKVIQHYLSALLTEEESAPDIAPVLADQKKAELNRLLAQAIPAVEAKTSIVDAVKEVSNVVSDHSLRPELHQREIPIADRLGTPSGTHTLVEKAYRKAGFQALFFNVAGLKIAVPLTELGGIHELTQFNVLPGKAPWFRGIMLHRSQKIQLVDTARWVMPEKYTATLATELNYQYVIMLGTSNWGLCCELLIDTINLEPEQIKWREQEGKRPWMAGLIKEQKCVLVDVDELVNLLNQGLDVNA